MRMLHRHKDCHIAQAQRKRGGGRVAFGAPIKLEVAPTNITASAMTGSVETASTQDDRVQAAAARAEQMVQTNTLQVVKC